MMTCESIQEELVAYRDGELPEQDRERIASHLQTCSVCAQAETQLARVEQLLVKLEKITPSSDFASTFWARLEKEKAQPNPRPLEAIGGKEHVLVRWWREVRETLNEWHIAPALAAAASLLVFFGYFLTFPQTRPSTKTQALKLASAPQKLVPTTAPPGVPADLLKNLDLYTHYKIIADQEEFSKFDEIAAVQLPPENPTEVAKEDKLPPELLHNPSFFAHYPILQEMDKLENLEAVLGMPTTTDEDPHKRG